MYFSKQKYEFLGFERSTRKNKKYAAILRDKQSNRVSRVHFGDSRYQHYKDTTGLNIYTHLDHLDKVRRSRFRSRHAGFIKRGFWSPSYFSFYFLW